MEKNREKEFQAVRSALSEVLEIEPEDIGMKSRLTEDLGADSLDRMRVLMKLEEHFRIPLDNAEFQSLSDVSEIADFLYMEEHRN